MTGRPVAKEFLLAPAELLKPHRARLSSLRLEGGYGPEFFEKLILAVVTRVAEYVHCLPATRVGNHCEEGGLLRLAIETGCFAFRQADGKFLAGSAATDIENRERDRIWRYAVLIGGLLRPLGRCATSVRVASPVSGRDWNALSEPLATWLMRVDCSSLEFKWEESVSSRTARAASLWIGARVLTDDCLRHLEDGGDGLTRQLLGVVSGDGTGRLCEIVDRAYEAAVERDMTQQPVNTELPRRPPQLEHRVLAAILRLAREQWIANAPGARLWMTREGVFLVWRAAVADLTADLGRHGAGEGSLADPDVLAETLLRCGVLSPNYRAAGGARAYFRLLPIASGVPRQALEVVKLADPELVCAQLSRVELIDARLLAPEAPVMRRAVDSPQLPLDVGPREPSPEVPQRSTEPEDAQQTPSCVTPKSEAPAIGVLSALTLERLGRFGSAGPALQALAHRLANDPSSVAAVRVPDGLALAFPQAVESLGLAPQEFLGACQAQGLLVPSHAGGRDVVRRRGEAEPHLPEHYVILASRVAQHLPKAS